jgi:asparagine synthase (glutamine-hydrolysing)
MRLPPDWKLWDGWNKRVMREAMRGRIPESVRARKQKFGFPSGAKRWFSGALATTMNDIVADSAAMRSGWFDVAAVRAEAARHQRGETDATNLLFNVAQVDSWLRLDGQAWARP